VKLRIGLLMLVCIGVSVLQSVLPLLLAVRDARADLLLCVVLYLALHDEWVQGGALSLFAGYLSDLGSAMPVGLYSFLAVLTFVVIRLAASAFKTDRGPRVVVLAVAASLVHSLFASLLFRFLVQGGGAFRLHLAGALWSALATGLGGLFVFAVLRRIDEGFRQHESAATGRGF
jgi:rod shape-determining protein MreD